MIDQMLDLDPVKRPSCKEALKLIQKVRAEFECEYDGGANYN